jgi:hypothetical protein
MNKVLSLITLALIVVTLSSCGDECSSYSDYSCTEIQNAKYNVYFYFPNQSEVYLGEAEGLSSCGSVAHAYAYDKNLSNNNDWSYICCMIAKGSSCYEKHR